MDLWADLLSLMNILLGLLVVTLQVQCFVRNKAMPWRWIKLALAVVGLYWAGLYVYVLLPVQHVDPVNFGRVFVRPAFTITLAMMAVGAIIRQRSGDCK